MAIIAFALLTIRASAQKPQSYWSIGFNPLSLAESMSSIGPSVAYRLSPAIELWAEGSIIFNNLYKMEDWKNLRGYRFIFQPRFYVGRSKKIFITPEFRLKHYSYNSTGTFINSNTVDTLDNYAHKASQTLIGGAFVAGTQLNLSKRKNFLLEVTAGIGAKQRNIKRKSIPSGYEYFLQTGGFGLKPHYEYDNDGTPYFPLGFRLVWKLK